MSVDDQTIWDRIAELEARKAEHLSRRAQYLKAAESELAQVNACAGAIGTLQSLCPVASPDGLAAAVQSGEDLGQYADERKLAAVED